MVASEMTNQIYLLASFMQCEAILSLFLFMSDKSLSPCLLHFMYNEIPKNGIDPNDLKAWRISGFIWSFSIILLSPAFFAVSHFLGPFPHIIGWLLLALPILSAYPLIFIVPKVRFARWRYEIREHDIDIQCGLIVLRRALIPIIRVQHIETSQGPILKRFDLTSLSISTAAGAHIIPALKTEIAAQLKLQLSEMARLSEEDV